MNFVPEFERIANETACESLIDQFTPEYIGANVLNKQNFWYFSYKVKLFGSSGT